VCVCVCVCEKFDTHASILSCVFFVSWRQANVSLPSVTTLMTALWQNVVAMGYVLPAHLALFKFDAQSVVASVSSEKSTHPFPLASDRWRVLLISSHVAAVVLHVLGKQGPP
jgi:hypothetical protein